MRPRIAILLVGLAAALGTPREGRGELVYFAKGGEAQIPATVEGDVVRLELPTGVLEFSRREFRKIVPGHWPAHEWDARRQKALSGTADDRFAAAWWALENGLTPEALALLREGKPGDSSHAPTSRMLAALARLETPCSDPPNLERLEQAIGVRAEAARGPHVLLLHQHSTEEASERVDLIERVTTTYYLMFAAQGTELPVPHVRMPSVWFADQHDYLAFLKSQEAGAFRGTRGYYHPTFKAVVAYDSRSDDISRASRDSLEFRRTELERFAKALETMPPRSRLRFELRGDRPRLLGRAEGKNVWKELNQDLQRREFLQDMDRRAIDLGTAAHEMVHQLVDASGLAPRHDDFPTWLQEGFAAQFEVIRGGRWSGVGRAHDVRLVDWRSIHPSPPLLPLFQTASFTQGYQRSLYAQSWALVYFLRKEHPESFQAYLDLLRTPNPRSPSTANRPLAAFHTVFGRDLEPLEQGWHRFLNSVRTPLGEERATPSVPRPESSSRD